MKRRALGKTGIKVSEISFGGVEIGMPYGIGVKNQEDMLSKTESIKLLHAAIDGGINFFDTARFYGKSENIMGKAFKKRRNEVVICTKCAHLKGDNNQLPADKELKKIIGNSLYESLSALQTEYVDVYMVHNADIEILENQEIAKVFSEYKKNGMAKAIGVSTYTVEETRKAIDSGIWDVIQVAFNIMDQRLSTIFSLAQQRDIGIVIRSVLFKGILTDRRRNLHSGLKAVERHRNLYDELLNEDTPKLSDLATKFVLSYNEVSSVLIGIDRMEYLKKALALANGQYLDEKTFIRAKELRYPEPDFLDLPKWDRMGWIK